MIYICDDARHLVCVPYSVKNLHKAAADLGIKRCWYHAKAKRKHYDIPKRRIGEIMAQCVVVTTEEIIEIINETGNGS